MPGEDHSPGAVREVVTTLPPTPKKAQPNQSSSEQGDAVRDILVEAARTQLAAVTAATTFWAGWADVADTYAKNVSDELAKLDAEDGDMGHLTDLPTASVAHFNSQLETIGKRTTQRTRAARAKP